MLHDFLEGLFSANLAHPSAEQWAEIKKRYTEEKIKAEKEVEVMKKMLGVLGDEFKELKKHDSRQQNKPFSFRA